MGDKANAHPGAAGRATAADHPASVRNVVLVGHSGSGKTTLVEALALTAGAVNRAGRVEDGGTVSDYDEIEHRQQRSVQLSLVPVDWDGYKVNLLDTPGYADFVGELRAGLRAADAALFVVSASDGVDGSTRMVWEECAAVGMPRAIVITHLESRPRGLRVHDPHLRGGLRRGRPRRRTPLYLPLHGAAGPDGHAPVTGLVGLLSQKLFDYASGERKESEPGSDQLPGIEEARNRLIEGIIAESEDETLMDRYLGGEEIDVETLIGDLERAVARGVFFPVLAAAPAAEGSRQGLGTVELLELITGGFPTPLERAAPGVTTVDGRARELKPCDPSGPLLAEVVKTASDPYVGRVSLVRVFSGTLRPDETVHVSGHGLADRGHEDHDVDERVGALSAPFGKQQRALTHCIAGDLACVAKLGRAETGDTLSAKDDPLLMEPWEMPDPLLPLAIQAHSKADEDKLSQGLSRLVAEDPTMRLEQNQDTHQVVLWCLGEAHADVALERLRSRYGVQVDLVAHKVSLRETFAAKAQGARPARQTVRRARAVRDLRDRGRAAAGRHGHRVRGQGHRGAVPRQFIPSVEKGVRAQAAKGVAAGHPLLDVRITLLDGKAHSVDSSDAAFQTAGALALREAAADAKIHLLEPVAEVTVLVGDDYVGAVMSDLSGRRGRVLGTEQTTGGRTLIRAEVPEIEIGRYAVDLRSLSHGTARFNRAYARHEPMPQQIAERIRQEAGDAP